MNDERLERLEQVLDAYGASPDRWPADDRTALSALIDTSDEARAMRDHAARLDALLDHGPEVSPPSGELMERILDGAPAPQESPTWWRPAAILPLAAAAVLALWIARDPASPPTAPTPAAEGGTIELAMADLGIYDTPTDVLLSIDGFDPLASVPGYDCEDAGLGCIELDLDGSERHSLQGDSRRMKT